MIPSLVPISAMRGEVQFRADKLGVLIDSDNISPHIVEPLLQEIAKLGTTYIKRVYGDWTSQRMSAWKTVLNNFALVPIQQFAYTTGKNATDSALIIDAMDILYTGNLDGFCIVSSDSDFTRLAHRIRQNGITVYGFGRKSTPNAFKASCDRFINTDPLHDFAPEKVTHSPQSSKAQNNMSKVKNLSTLLLAAYQAVSHKDGKANLGQVGQQILRIDPAFDPKNYGHKKLGDLVKATNLFKIKGNDIMVKE